MLERLGNINNALPLAKYIKTQSEVQTSFALRKLIFEFYENKLSNKDRFNVLVRVFQALRIVVNKELENLQNFLQDSTKMVRNKSIFAVITFHELEAEICKKYLGEIKQNKNFKVKIKEYGKKASKKEIENNNPSRSAKLFVWEIEKLRNH